MEKSENINELAAALAKAQAVMKPAKMDSVNPFLKNKYADLGAVIEASRKPLADNGLAVSQMVSTDGDIITLETILLHSSGQWLSSHMSIQADQSKGMSFAQSVGAVITYMRRYSYSAIVGIYADEDTDDNDHQQARQQARPQTVQAHVQAKKEPVSAVLARLGQEEEAPALVEVPHDVLQAERFQTRDGQSYGKLTTEKLSYMVNAMTEALKKEPNAADVEERQAKLEAARTILAWRKEHPNQ